MQGLPPSPMQQTMMPAMLTNTPTQAFVTALSRASLPDCSSHYFPFGNSPIRGRTGLNFVRPSGFVRQSASMSCVSLYTNFKMLFLSSSLV